MNRDLKRHYTEDLALFEGPWSRALAGLLLLAICVYAAIFAGPYTLYVMTLVALAVIAAIGLNLLMGYTGQISLGHAAFLAIGAYTHTIVYTKGAPLIVSVLIAALVAAVFGFLIGIPALRLKGPYLAIATLGFQVAIDQLLARWTTLTGGRMGLRVPAAEIFVELSPLAYFFVCLAITLAIIVGAYNITRSRVGRAWVAIRDNETAAESMGVHLTHYKTMAFAISAAITGISGALSAHLADSITPNNYTLLNSIELLVMVMVGGLASILGSILGGTLIVLLSATLASFRDYQGLLIGLILIAVILFEPMGMRGRWLRTKAYFKAWPF